MKYIYIYQIYYVYDGVCGCTYVNRLLLINNQSFYNIEYSSVVYCTQLDMTMYNDVSNDLSITVVCWYHCIWNDI